MLRSCTKGELFRRSPAALWGRAGGLFFAIVLCLCANFLATGCGKNQADASAGAPPPLKVEQQPDSSMVKVDRPERFALVTVGQHDARPSLSVTGVVNPDVSRQVPVMSLASGRVVEIHARLGDSVRKGQLLMRVKLAEYLLAKILRDREAYRI